MFTIKKNSCSSDMLRSLSLLTSPFLPFLPPEMKRAPLGQSAREEGAISHFPISRAAEKIIPCCESSMRRPDIIMNSPTLPPTQFRDPHSLLAPKCYFFSISNGLVPTLFSGENLVGVRSTTGCLTDFDQRFRAPFAFYCASETNRAPHSQTHNTGCAKLSDTKIPLGNLIFRLDFLEYFVISQFLLTSCLVS